MLQIRGERRFENLRLWIIPANQILDRLPKIAACLLKRARDKSFKRGPYLKDLHLSEKLSLKGDGSEIVLSRLQQPGTQGRSLDAAIQYKIFDDAIEAKANLVEPINPAALPVKNGVCLPLDPPLNPGLELQPLLSFCIAPEPSP